MNFEETVHELLTVIGERVVLAFDEARLLMRDGT
jgi:hypothetical protein